MSLLTRLRTRIAATINAVALDAFGPIDWRRHR